MTVSDSGLLTCAGGKWTTYREMAEDAVNTAMNVFQLQPTRSGTLPDISGMDPDDTRQLDGSCQTRNLLLVGAHGYSRTLFIDLIRHYGVDEEVARHLARSYGDRAWEVARLSSSESDTASPPSGQAQPKRLSAAYPYLDGEVRYAVRNEYAGTAADFLSRRIRLAFLDTQAALETLPSVIDLMGEELLWSKARKDTEWTETLRFLASMGLPDSMLDVSREQVVSGDAVMKGDKMSEQKREFIEAPLHSCFFRYPYWALLTNTFFLVLIAPSWSEKADPQKFHPTQQTPGLAIDASSKNYQ